jgi:hypothetical protein
MLALNQAGVAAAAASLGDRRAAEVAAWTTGLHHDAGPERRFDAALAQLRAGMAGRG